ncbi:MAG: SRPBCC family protein [Solirubrobacterales bacterium]
MGMSWAEHSVEIEAPIEVAFDAIVDYESFGGWQNAVDSVEVIDRTPEGVGRTVRLFVDAKIRKIDYVLRYSYARPTRIEWDFVEGNGMRYMDGTYTFEQLGPGRTRATYNLGADPEIPVPGMVLRRTHKQLVKRSVEDLKREAERRAATGAGAEAGSQAPPPEAAPEPTEPAREAAPRPEPAAPAPQPAKPAPEPSASAPEAPAVPPAPAAPEAAPPPEAAPEPEPVAPPEPAPSPASGAAPPASGDWVPLGARGGPGRSGRSGEREGPPSALPAEELAERAAAAAGQALRIGRGLAAGALRAGVAAGREAAERIDRRLSGREPYEPR